MKTLATIWRGLQFAGLVLGVLCLICWLFIKALFTGHLKEFFGEANEFMEEEWS